MTAAHPSSKTDTLDPTADHQSCLLSSLWLIRLLLLLLHLQFLLLIVQLLFLVLQPFISHALSRSGFCFEESLLDATFSGTSLRLVTIVGHDGELMGLMLFVARLLERRLGRRFQHEPRD